MSLLKDFREDVSGYKIFYQLRSAVDVRLWLRLHKYRKQRANRGWSDRDAWGAGEHIAKVTAEMLQHLNDYSYCDWPEWFKNNTDNLGYKNLQSVIDDINNYLEFQYTGWTDGLDVASYDVDDWIEKEPVNGLHVWKSAGWINIETGKKLTEKQVTARISKHHKQEQKLYAKATKAMEFFGRNFASFWD